MQRTTRMTIQPAGAMPRAALLAVALVAGSAAQAAVMEYQLLPGSTYERTRLDPASQLPVAGASVGIGGTIRIDTATGVLVSAQFDLGDYTEYFDYAPLTPFSNYALIDHDDELQSVGAAAGSVLGTVIRFAGANAWSTAASGSAACSASGGVQGNATCAGAALAGWSPFAIDLLFTPDFSAVYASSSWTDSGATTDGHALNLFAVRAPEVPLPGAVWLMGSGLTALLAARLRRPA